MLKRLMKKNLVNRVVRTVEVETEVYKSAELISEGAPKVARWHKAICKRDNKNW